jgi:hypothetical protein
VGHRLRHGAGRRRHRRGPVGAVAPSCASRSTSSTRTPTTSRASSCRRAACDLRPAEALDGVRWFAGAGRALHTLRETWARCVAAVAGRLRGW